MERKKRFWSLVCFLTALLCHNGGNGEEWQWRQLKSGGGRGLSFTAVVHCLGHFGSIKFMMHMCTCTVLCTGVYGGGATAQGNTSGWQCVCMLQLFMKQWLSSGSGHVVE